MAVYRYQASAKNREDHIETGTVVARNEAEAKKKLQDLDFDRVKVKKIGGFSGIFRKFGADVR